MTDPFDFDKALKAIQSGQAISGEEGVLAPLLNQLTEAALEAELESHIADDVVPNRKNGRSRKTLKTSEGRIDLNTPRDRAGTSEPQIIKKNQTSGDLVNFFQLDSISKFDSCNDLRQVVNPRRRRHFFPAHMPSLNVI